MSQTTPPRDISQKPEPNEQAIDTESSHSLNQDGQNGHLTASKQDGDMHSSHCHEITPKTVISFGPGDPDHPQNWPKALRLFVFATGGVGIANAAFGATTTSGSSSQIAAEFNIENHEVVVLVTSLFILGYVLGPFLWGPATEAYGRRWPLMIASIFYTIFTMASGLASSYPQLLVFRMFSGMAGVAPMTSAYGVYADLEADITARGRLCANLVTASQSAPIFGAFIGGFIAIPGWRWCCWFCLICAGITLPMSIFMPETFAPIILKRRAELLRKTTGKINIVAPIELSHQGFKDKVTSNFSRPFHMLFTEPIVYCSAIFLSLTYAMGFVYLQAYPLIFKGIYGLNSAYTGICFLPIFVGIAIAHVLFIWYENFLANARARNASWVDVEEYRRLPLACLGGPSYVVALFWISWTARSGIHWSVPALSGISFGIGWNINFQTLTNYVNDAYGIYSASANAAVTSCRCLFGAVLPLAVKPMFDHLGVNWGCSLLAFVSLAVSVVPFVFIYCGTRIRANSKFCRELQKLQEHEMKEASSDSEAGVAVIDSRPKDVEKQGYR